VQREGKREHADGTQLAGHPARRPRAGRPAADHQRGTHAHGVRGREQPRVEHSWRRCDPTPVDTPWLLEAHDGDPRPWQRQVERDQVARLDPPAGPV